MAAASSYDYSPLSKHGDEIRLVQVLAPGDKGQINCHITSYPLSKAPKYVALSYTWGRPDPDCCIYMNGRRLPVRKNLLRFLQQMSSSARYRNTFFWIDALCINQANTEERTHQVGLMAKTYGSAHQVFVWLGPAYANSTVAMKALRKRTNPISKQLWSSPEGYGLRGLCQRTYWSRLWILQELVLAKDIRLLCGDSEASWSHFVSFFKDKQPRRLPNHSEPNRERQYAVESLAISMVEQVSQAHTDTSLLDQMRRSLHLECAEPRDRIFALLGIVKSGIHGLTPDYGLSISTLLNSVIGKDFSIEPPTSLTQVRSRCGELVKLMGMDIEVIFSLGDSITSSESTNTLMVHQETGVSLLWADKYGHDLVKTSWEREHDLSNIHKSLCTAAADGKDEYVRILLQLRCTTDVVRNDDCFSGHYMMTPVHLASRWGHESTVQLILRERPSWTNVVSHGESALLMAIRRGDLMMVQCLLDSSQVEHSDLSLISTAAARGHEDILQYLIAHGGFDINGVTTGKPPLVAAALSGHLSIIEILLKETRIAANAQSSEPGGHHGYTALHVATINDHRDTVKLLLSRADIDVNIKNNKGHTPLHHATMKGHIDVLKMLLAHPAIDVNAASNSGATALISAAHCGVEDAVKLLLKHPNIDVSAKDDQRETALNMAIGKGHTEERHINVLKMFLAHSAIDVNAANRYGWTALMSAADCGLEVAVKLLLWHPNINIDAKDVMGDTALDKAIKEGHFQIKRLLRKRHKADRRKQIATLTIGRFLSRT